MAMLKSQDQRRDGVMEIDGAQMGYTAYGPIGPNALLFIHGASANRRDLEIALGDRLPPGEAALFIDRPGFGQSSRPPGAEDPFRQAELIAGAARQLGATQPVVIGHSVGGAIALAYALAHAEHLSGLVLLAPVSHPWPGGVDFHHHAAIHPTFGGLFRRLVTPLIGPLIARRHMKPPLPSGYYQTADLQSLFRTDTFLANSMDIAHLEGHIRNMCDDYHKIIAPTHILVGDWDHTVSPMIHAFRLSKQIPDADMTVIQEAGHMLQHEHPQHVIDAIEKIIRRRRPAP